MLLALGRFFTLTQLFLGNLISQSNPRMLSGVPLGELSDSELIDLCRDRGFSDERPYRELWRRHEKMVWRTCYGFVKNPEDAEDLSQDVFLKAFRKLKTFEGRSSFKTWINRIAINTSHNELRRRSSRITDFAEWDEDTMEDEVYVQDQGPSIESQVNMSLVMQQMAEAIQNMTEDEWGIIYLKDVEDLTYREIAEELGISVSAAKMRVQRARINLQGQMHLVEAI